MANPYTNLRFASNVDWKDVNPTLLGKLNKLGRGENLVIDVFSGYRSNEYSARVGGFAGDPHTRGIAVDANVAGAPIGDTVTPETFARYGLLTGNQPNFYNGKPDPAHVQLKSGKYTPPDGTAPTSPAPSSPAATSPDTAVTAPTVQPPPSSPVPTAPELPQSSLELPGTEQFTLNRHEVASTWQQLAESYPSPETQQFAYLSKLAAAPQ